MGKPSLRRLAPEILKQEPYGTLLDWWALGCSIYVMVAGRVPFRRTLEDKCKFEHQNFDAPSKDIISLHFSAPKMTLENTSSSSWPHSSSMGSQHPGVLHRGGTDSMATVFESAAGPDEIIRKR